MGGVTVKTDNQDAILGVLRGFIDSNGYLILSVDSETLILDDYAFTESFDGDATDDQAFTLSRGIMQPALATVTCDGDTCTYYSTLTDCADANGFTIDTTNNTLVFGDGTDGDKPANDTDNVTITYYSPYNDVQVSSNLWSSNQSVAGGGSGTTASSAIDVSDQDQIGFEAIVTCDADATSGYVDFYIAASLDGTNFADVANPTVTVRCNKTVSTTARALEILNVRPYHSIKVVKLVNSGNNEATINARVSVEG